MPKSTNVLVISGNLTRAPKVFDNDDGSRSAAFTVAVNGSKKVDGEWQDDPEFVGVRVYGGQVDAIETYCDKGKHVVCTGRLGHPRLYEVSGEWRAESQMVAHSVEFGPKASNGDSAPAPRQATQRPAAAAKPVDEDDIPF